MVRFRNLLGPRLCSRRIIIPALTITAFVVVQLVSKYRHQSSPFHLSDTNTYNSINYESRDPEFFLIKTASCEIPNIDPWEKYLDRDVDKIEDCMRSQPHLAYVDKTDLVFNWTAVIDNGYSTEKIDCCYRAIEREEQTIEKYDENADNLFRFSSACYSITPASTKYAVTDEFIKVHCTYPLVPFLSRSLNYNREIYRSYLAIPTNNKRLKVETTNSNPNSFPKKPPNVVVFWVDSNSRLNSHRNAPETVKFLEKIGAIEMLGYTKVGENTFPNFVAAMSGYSEEELEPICYSSRKVAQDDCPYILKAFSQSGYLTLYAEDFALTGSFNYLKTGFVRQPADFYRRPLMIAALEGNMDLNAEQNCLGNYLIEEPILQYVNDVIEASSSSEFPVFATLLINRAHANNNNLRIADDIILKFVKELEHTNNTIFFFMADHGQRFGTNRKTIQGWYEDKLPSQWIYLPAEIKQQFPQWDTSLKFNSKSLTSHFDLHHTLRDIVTEFGHSNSAPEFFQKRSPQTGQTLFKPLPSNRTCEDAGIPINYCPCFGPRTGDVEDLGVREAAEAAVAFLAQALPSACAKPSLKKVVSVYYVPVPEPEPRNSITVVSFLTSPGDFLFEAYAEKESSSKYVVKTSLLRMNKMTRPANCVETPTLQRYCYCK